MPRTIRAIEEYYIDTSLDNDSDPFSINIGDPDGDLIKALKRDNEVRVQIFGVDSSQRGTSYMVTGVADEITYNEMGVVTITGRDLSSLATDSTLPPKQYRHVRAWKLVQEQARELGIGGRLNLSKGIQVKKSQYTDGSETYWEFWNRLYRKEKMWIWFGPQGQLNAGKLHYEAAPSYFFGKPKSNDPSRIKDLYQQVENVQVKKTTQGRLGEVWVYGQKGDSGFLVTADDPTVKNWIKKPRKIIFDKEVHNRKQALKEAWEEIFEGKVGSVEITLTVGDPGFPIRQNRVARVRIPEMNLYGDYFVVGTRMSAGPDGFVQEIRLRERGMALSRRIPPDPSFTTAEPKKDVGNQLGVELEVPYADDFIKAAREWHGPWNFPLFLATLLAIGDQETSFNNIRALGGPGEDRVPWYQWKAVNRDRKYADDPPVGTPKDRFGRTHEQWKEIFANEPGQYTSETFAVGIMQLYSLGYKHWADDKFKTGNQNQYSGGRWHPPSNIWAAARALRNKLQLAVRDSGRDADIWAGVSYYGHHYAGETPTTVPTRYAKEVKAKVQNTYLQQVNDALKAAQEAAKAQRDGSGSEGNQGDSPVPRELPQSAQECMRIFRGLGPNPTRNEQRAAVRAVAMYGYYRRDEIDYDQGQRAADFSPPPNVPAHLDCSSFAEWCYKSCGIDDPSNQNYHPIGNTRTQVANGTAIHSINGLNPGDLIFYGGTPSYPGHVAVYAGNGKVISMGSDPGPLILPINYRSDRIAMRAYI